MIYADHAATTPLCAAAREAMNPYLEECFYNPSSQYRQGIRARQAIEKSRRKIAELLQCRSDEIYFTSGGSEGNSWAAWIGSQAGNSGTGSRLATTTIEHHSMLRAMDGMQRVGGRVTRIGTDERGRILESELEAALAGGASLVSVQYANNEVGTIQDMEEIAERCRKAGALLHSDAVQAVGHLAIPIQKLDLMTVSAHKFGGPKGVGFLYIRKGVPVIPLIYGGDQEQGVRGGTEQVAGIVGMAAALEQAVDSRDMMEAKLRMMEQEFCKALQTQVCGVRFHGDPDQHLPGLCSVALPGMDAEQVIYRMDLLDFAVSAGAACDQRRGIVPSHVLKAMGIPSEEIRRTIRISFGMTNQPGDGRKTAEALVSLLK